MTTHYARCCLFCLTRLTASPPVLGMWLQTVKFIVKKSKCASLHHEIDFSTPNSHSRTLVSVVNGATQLCTSKKECNELDLTAAEYFWLVDHNDWSRWFAISSSHIYAVLCTVLLVGLPKEKAKLRHLILLSRVTYRARVEMMILELPQLIA